MSIELIKTFTSRLEAIQGELLATPGMIDASAFTMGKASTKEIEAFEAAAKATLPTYLREFFLKVGSYCIEWKYQNPENSLHKVFGLCFIYSLDQMLNHPDPRVNSFEAPKYQNLLWHTGDPPALIRKLQDFFVLDKLKYDNFVLINFQDESLYLYTRPYILKKLSINFDQYVDLTLRTRGIYLWQQYVVENSDENPFLPDAFHSNMTSLFPGVDISDLSLGAKKDYYPYSFRDLESQHNYASQFEEMVNNLKQSSKIEQVKFRMNRINIGAHPADFHRAFIATGFSFPESIIQFYQDVNGLSLCWKGKEDDSIAADFCLLSLDDMFAGYDPDGLDWELRRPWTCTATQIYQEYEAEDNSLIGLERYYLIYREERINVLIRFNQNSDCDLLLVYDYDRYMLDLSFEKFIEYLLMFRGAKYWLFLFISSEAYSEIGLPENYIERIRAIFPDIEFQQ